MFTRGRSVHWHTVLLAQFATLLAPSSLATPVNVTIDDQTGDAITGLLPTYNPSIAWNQGAGCDFCSAKPNTSDAFNGTWHDATYSPGVYPEQFDVTLQFNGTAIWMFNILDQRTLTALNFTLDGEDAGSFVWDNASSFQFLYNQAVFGREGLQFGPHTLVAAVTTSNSSLILFDYAIYTTDSDALPSTSSNTSATSTPTASTGATSSPSSHSPVGAIVGGVVGGIAAIVLLVFAIFCFLRRRRSSSKPSHLSASSVSPFTSETSGSERTPTGKASHSTLGPLSSPDPVRNHRAASASPTESSFLPHLRHSPPPPSFNAPAPSSAALPSVLDIRRDTRTMATTPAGPMAQSTTSSQSARERQLEQEIEALRSEMRGIRGRKAGPVDVLPGYDSASGDVLIHREP